MYFLEQIRKQFILTVTLGVGGPEGANETVVQQESEIPEVEVTPGEALDHAQTTTRALDTQVSEQEALGLSSSSPNLSFGSDIPSGEIDTSGFDLNEVELSQAAPAAIGNGPRDEYDMGERVSSPEEAALLSRLAEGEIGFDDPDVSTLAEELGMEEVLRTAGIDGLERGEVPEGIEESTPEMLEGSRDEVQGEIDTLSVQITSLPEGSPQRENLERRASFLGGFIQAIEDAINGQQPGIDGGAGGFSGVDVVGDRNVMARGMSHRGIHERTGQADKFLMGLAQDARQTPWCAGFVSYVCKEAGYDITPTLSSKAFIGETGKGHVAFYAGNGQMLGGNQSNSVSLAPIRKEIQGWTMPADLEAGRAPNRGGTPPVGAIIVFNRGGSDRNMA